MRAGTREAIALTANMNTTFESHSAEQDEHDTEENAAIHPSAVVGSDGSQAPTFAELGVADDIVRALSEAGIERTFAIQELALPLALNGEDVIGQARTGMGKTLGFGIPLLQRLQLPGDGTPQVLVVVPTRELCLQVAHDLTETAKRRQVRTLAVYGGQPYEPQIEALRDGVDVIVGTPGRLLDLAEQRHLVLGKLAGLVLDEADEMLDLGFLPDIERILGMVPEKRQTMLFSATMPDPIIKLARTFLQQPTHIRAENNDAGAVHERTVQHAYRAHSLDKPELIARVLQAEDRGLTMIFTRTKRTAQKVTDELNERGFAAGAVHGDLGQEARERALHAFRSGTVDVLVATDVAARGIDVDDVTHVLNYQTPEDEKTYIHRIGRTGRAGKTGVAITLVDWDEIQRWKLISDELGLGMPEPRETYSTSEHLFTELGIPRDATGRLSLAGRKRAGRAAGQGKPGSKQASRSSTGRGGKGGSDQRRRRNRTRGATRAAASNGNSPQEHGQHSADSAGHQAGHSPGSTSSKRRRRTRGGRRSSTARTSTE